MRAAVRGAEAPLSHGRARVREVDADACEVDADVCEVDAGIA
ncbi:MAG: hypothetical protein WAL52_21340 [Candidatus Sulfotelmatobacter sp.]